MLDITRTEESGKSPLTVKDLKERLGNYNEALSVYFGIEGHLVALPKDATVGAGLICGRDMCVIGEFNPQIFQDKLEGLWSTKSNVLLFLH